MFANNVKKIFSFFIWASLIFIAVYLPKLFSYQWWSLLVSVLPFWARLAYEHFDSINLLTNRIFLWATNKEVAWEMKARFGGNFSDADLEPVIQAINDKSLPMHVIQSGEFERVISIPSFGIVIKILVAEFRHEELESRVELVLAIQRVFVPFRHSTKTINIILSVLNRVREIVDFENEKYEFKVVFGETNPYLGLFVKRLKLIDRSRLLIDYQEEEGTNRAKITVSKEKVSLITHDVHSLQAFSNKYITLSSLNLLDS